MESRHIKPRQAQEVRALQVPLEGINLIIPDSIILQVLNSKDIMSIPDGPKWLIGMVDWQKRKIPIISFEAAAGRQYEESQYSRLLVIKSLNNIEKMPFYAIFLSAIPHPIRLNEENISAVENVTNVAPVILSEVLVYGEQSSIPNFDVLEEMLMDQESLFKEAAARRDNSTDS